MAVITEIVCGPTVVIQLIRAVAELAELEGEQYGRHALMSSLDFGLQLPACTDAPDRFH